MVFSTKKVKIIVILDLSECVILIIKYFSNRTSQLGTVELLWFHKAHSPTYLERQILQLNVLKVKGEMDLNVT